MNDIVRYDVYSPERDRREFRYLFPAVFLYVLLYIADVGTYVFGVERTVIAFIGGIAPDEAGVIIDQPAKFVRRVGILGHCIFFMEHPINPVCDNRIARIHWFGSCRRFASFQFLPCIFGGLNVGEIIGEFLFNQTEQQLFVLGIVCGSCLRLLVRRVTGISCSPTRSYRFRCRCSVSSINSISFAHSPL